MLLAPIESLNVICKVVFGLALVIAGIYNLVVYIRDMENMNLLNVFSGVIVLVIGMFLFYNPGVVIALLPKLLGNTRRLLALSHTSVPSSSIRLKVLPLWVDS